MFSKGDGRPGEGCFRPLLVHQLLKGPALETESATGPWGRINWLEICSALFSGSGVVATIVWLTHPSRDLACMDSYWTPAYQPVIALTLVVVGGALSLALEPTTWVVVARWLTGVALGVTLIVVILLPLVIHAVAYVSLEWAARNARRRKSIWIPRSWAAFRGLLVGAAFLWLDWGVTFC